MRAIGQWHKAVHTVKEIFTVLLLDFLLTIHVHNPIMRHSEKLVIYQTYRCFVLAYHEEQEDLIRLSPVHSWENEERGEAFSLWFKDCSLLWTLAKKGRGCFIAMTLFFKIWVKQSSKILPLNTFVQIYDSVMIFLESVLYICTSRTTTGSCSLKRHIHTLTFCLRWLKLSNLKPWPQISLKCCISIAAASINQQSIFQPVLPKQRFLKYLQCLG